MRSATRGIEVVDSEGQYRDRQRPDRRLEGVDDVELDLTPSALDKINDPVRLYLREMGKVSLLTREGEGGDRQAVRTREAVDRQGGRPDGRTATER